MKIKSWHTYFLLILLAGCRDTSQSPVSIYLIGDSTMADYSDNYDPGKDYMKSRFPMTGWGQVFQELFHEQNFTGFENLIDSDSVIIKNRARGGRSTRTFFQEGRWRKVYDDLKEGDLVLMQFGHNDAAVKKTERYVNAEGYKEFLRLYVQQTREKGATPIILTPVCRNYPWKNGQLQNVHGSYPAAAKAIVSEMNVLMIDLNRLSMEKFSSIGRDKVTHSFFMNLPEGKYEAYPDGLKDNTHFQPAGARVVANLVFEALKDLSSKEKINEVLQGDK